MGRVIPGVQIVILDEDLKPQPVGGSGEVGVLFETLTTVFNLITTHAPIRA